MVRIPNMLEENVDYELIPSSDKNDYWDIRILKGDFIESVINFGKIKVNESEDCLNFDFTLRYSPDPDLNSENLELQRYVGKILESVIINNLNEMEK